MALDEFVYDLDGRLLADLRLVVTEMVTTVVRSGSGSPLSVRVEAISPAHIRGEIEAEDEPMDGNAVLTEDMAPILDELTSRWGLGPHPRRMWFEMEAD